MKKEKYIIGGKCFYFKSKYSAKYLNDSLLFAGDLAKHENSICTVNTIVEFKNLINGDDLSHVIKKFGEYIRVNKKYLFCK